MMWPSQLKRFIAESVGFKTAISIMQDFEQQHKAADHVTEIDDYNKDLTHVDEAAQIIKDQKYSLRQKIFDASF